MFMIDDGIRHISLIHRAQHKFYEDQSQTIETVRRACQMDQERIFYKSMIETSRIIRRTTDFRGNISKTPSLQAIVLAFRKLFSPVSTFVASADNDEEKTVIRVVTDLVPNILQVFNETNDEGDADGALGEFAELASSKVLELP
ncbi:unnamed protein product [Caenorhabditis nigoni]